MPFFFFKILTSFESHKLILFFLIAFPFFLFLSFFLFFGQLFVALVSSYRYEGPKVHEDTAKSEAKTLYNAVINAAKKPPIEDEDVVRILSIRSKLHLKSVFKYYKEFSGEDMEEVQNWNFNYLVVLVFDFIIFNYLIKIIYFLISHDESSLKT